MRRARAVPVTPHQARQAGANSSWFLQEGGNAALVRHPPRSSVRGILSDIQSRSGTRHARRDVGAEECRVRRRAGDRRVRGAHARRRRRAAGHAAPNPRRERRRRVPPGAGPRRPHRPGQLQGLRAARHARRPRALHFAHRRRRHVSRPHRQARHLHLPQLRHDAGEAQVPALQPGARQVHDADIQDFLRFQEQGVPRGGRQGAAVHLRQPAVQHHGRADGDDGHHERVPQRGVHAHHARHPVAGVQPQRGGLRPGLRAVALLPPPLRPPLRRRGAHRLRHLRPQPRARLPDLRARLGGALRRHPPRRPLAGARRRAGPPQGRGRAPGRAQPGARRRGGRKVRRPQQLVRGHPGAVPQRQVRARHHDRVHGALRQEAPTLRRRTAARRRRVRLVGGVDRRQRRAGGATGVRHVHRAPQHRLLRVHPAQNQRRRRSRGRRLVLRRGGPCRPDRGHRRRALRGCHDHVRRVVPVPAGRRGEGGRVLQLDAQAQVRVPAQPDADHQHRQEQRAGPADGRGQRGQDPGGGEAGGGGLQQPRRRVARPRPLRRLLGAQRGRRRRRRAAELLRRAGPGLHGPRVRGLPEGPRHRPAGAAGAAAGHLPEGAAPLPRAGRRREPVQVAALRPAVQRRRPPDLLRQRRQGLLQRRLRLTLVATELVCYFGGFNRVVRCSVSASSVSTLWPVSVCLPN